MMTNEFFEALRDKHYSDVFALCVRVTKNYHDAEEAAQNTFLRVWLKYHTFRGQSSFSSWLYRVAWNEAGMIWRVNHRRAREFGGEEIAKELAKMPSNHDTPEISAEIAELKRVVNEVVKTVRYADTLKLTYWGDLEQKEACRVLGIETTAGKSRLHRGRENFKRAWILREKRLAACTLQ